MAELHNTAALQAVAHGLGDMLPEVVFVGGATIGLYASRPAAPISRPTDDVDCIIELASYGAFAAMEERLRARGFRHDTESGVQIRWEYQGVPVDMMPTEATVLGFSNPWYPPGMATAQPYLLPDGTTIKILHPAYLLATKFCARQSRATDLRLSHDWEDIVYVCEERASLVEEVASAAADVRTYISDQCAEVLRQANKEELVEAVMSRDATVDSLLTTLHQLVALGSEQLNA
ncbi:nucleotidyl transferase AbiEii/AbiGii toxin family protein [Hymenobacter sp. 5317J-9]|uniref:nucleotidyl transferase AbiEii/AbiGii toxin family protein n=1 Tax=Hymenobacter sp. 5317J-9 TaxID=2932250 RepID=UPI001FD70125|nr:nucleotidyl transferase AbiEii/AbiGii toxin family protein [Hymenobacter sp. 5317J-9]UOQ99075.1 nucleotidyl transferase AbiEii/AbiGii toxin family protein [Hymenobacter sp. 5317J-9]